MRISRPCYDKFHRCPGWAGGGLKYAKKDRCDGGSMASFGGVYYKANGTLRGRHWRLWRFNKCPKCGVIVLPYMIRWADPGYLLWKIPRAISDWHYDRTH